MSREIPEEPVDSEEEAWADDSDRKAWILASSLLGAALILHGLAYYLLPGWLWGAGTLDSLNGFAVVTALILGVVGLMPAPALVALGVLMKAWDFSPRWAAKDILGAFVFAGVPAAVLFWKLGVRDPVGGAWLFHAPYAGLPEGATETAQSMPILIQSAVSGLSAALNTSNAQAVRGLAICFGVAFCWMALLLPKREDLHWKPILGFLLAFSGAALIFISPRADLAFQAFATAALVVLGLASLRGYVSPLLPGVAACCAALVHPIGFALLPAWAFLLWRQKDSRPVYFWLGLIGSSALTAAVLVALDAAVGGALDQTAKAAKSLWFTGSGTRAHWVLDWAVEEGALGAVMAVIGWIAERIWGTLNGLLFVAPVGSALAVSALAYGSRLRRSPAFGFLCFAAVMTGLLALTAAPYPGPPRSWGVYVPFGICVTALGAWWLAQQFQRRDRFKALAVGAVVVSLIHVLPPLFASRQVDVASERLRTLMSAPSPWDIRGRASALEQLGAFYLIAGDTLLAAEQLEEAWKMRPNPLYLGTAGTYYAGMKRFDLAEKQFARLVEERPFDRQANLSLGILHALNGRMEEAEQYLLVAYGDTSLALPEPEMDSPYWVDLPHGPERERIRTQRMMARKNSQEAFEEGEAAVDRGDLETAERLYRRALEIYPLWGRMQYEVHNHVGTIYAMEGRTRDAAYELLLALNSYRNYPLCYFVENGIGYGPARRAVRASRGGEGGGHLQ